MFTIETRNGYTIWITIVYLENGPVMLESYIPIFTGSRPYLEPHPYVPLNQFMTEISCVPVQRGHLLEENLLFGH